eukprot:scaffold8775_cov129-Isochrysis_galbana.AAC.1
MPCTTPLRCVSREAQDRCTLLDAELVLPSWSRRCRYARVLRHGVASFRRARPLCSGAGAHV